jgi:hypothetical protein
MLQRRALAEIAKMLRKSGYLAVPEPVPENLLTGKPSICKNEHGREVTFRPFRSDESRPIPLKAVN